MQLDRAGWHKEGKQSHPRPGLAAIRTLLDRQRLFQQFIAAFDLLGELLVGRSLSHLHPGIEVFLAHADNFDAGLGKGIDHFLLAFAKSEEHTSELQSLMRISYAVFCLKQKNTSIKKQSTTTKHT